MSEVELGEYLRTNGITREDLDNWRKVCEKANEAQAERARVQMSELAKEKAKVKALSAELQRKEKALAEAAALLVLRKKADAIWGGQRGRLTSSRDRKRAVELVCEAHSSGARYKACTQELGISLRSFERWRKGGEETKDKRCNPRDAPANALSDEERQGILDICNTREFSSLPPTQIVPALADKGIYLASESSFYRVLRKAKQLRHRSRSRHPKKRHAPIGCATGPGEIWVTDISWLAGPVVGVFYYLYFVMDLFSRKIVGYEVYESQSSENLAKVVHRATLKEGSKAPKILHQDNGSPMKGTALLGLCHSLGILPSYSRPGVSDDNPHIEALFRTTKYWPGYPYGGFATIDEARSWIYKFVIYYNNHHRHSSLKFITPHEMSTGEAAAILSARKSLYESAKAKRPDRWISGAIRDWTTTAETWITPPSSEQTERRNTA